MNEEHSFEVRKRKHGQGYGPKPSAQALTTWRAPDLTEQEQQERKQLIESGAVPF